MSRLAGIAAVVIGLLLTASAHAEEDGPATEPAPFGMKIRHVQTWLPTPDLAFAYRGTGYTLVHPGLSARLTWNLRQRDVRVNRARPRHRTRTWYAGGDLGASVRMYNNTLVALQATAGTRLVRTSGITTGWSVGVGPNRAFLNHPTWRRDDEGAVKRAWLRGQWSAATTLTWEIGWDLQRLRESRRRPDAPAHPVQWFVRPSFTLLTPWLDIQAPVLFVDIGVRAPVAAWVRR